MFAARNQRFHAVMAQAACGVVSDVFVGSLEAPADGVRVGVTYSARKQAAVATAHEAIVAALRSGDPDAEAAMRERPERYRRRRTRI
jgi:GntR family transcriptional regulator, transcriptional repressor for pyruvate dehydrogenase complex